MAFDTSEQRWVRAGLAAELNTPTTTTKTTCLTPTFFTVYAELIIQLGSPYVAYD